MNTDRDKRALGFLLIMLVATAGLVYAAVPGDTLRTTAAGVSTLVVDYLNSTRYYIGATEVTGYIQNANPAGDANFGTVDTGQGAYELWGMDQNVLTTSDVNFTSVEADNLYVRGNYNVTQLAMYPQQPASYIIWRDGSIYYAKSGTGSLEFSGTDASTVIQNAIDGLTSGRTWKEKVVLKGSFQVSGLVLYNYTFFDLTNGKLILKDNVDGFAISATNGYNIEIIGGIIDGNKDNNAVGGGIHLADASNCTIKNMYIFDCKVQGIDLGSPSHSSYGNLITENFFYNCGEISSGEAIRLDGNENTASLNTIDLAGYGIYVRNGYGNKVQNNVIKNTLNSGIAVSEQESPQTIVIGNYLYNCADGIYVSHDSYNSIIQGNIINKTTSKYGIWINNGKVICDGNIILNATQHGIYISSPSGENASDIIVSNNYVFGSGWSGIRTNKDDIYFVNSINIKDNIVSFSFRHGICLKYTNIGIVGDNIIKNNNQDGGTTYDAISLWDAQKITICYNKLFDDQTTKTQYYAIRESGASDFNIIKDNDIRNNRKKITIVGSNTLISENAGFVTENAGNATLAAITSSITVNHGCDYTPTLGDIQVTPSRDLGNCTYYWMDTFTATQFTIHVGAAGAPKNIDKTVYFLWSVRRH